MTRWMGAAVLVLAIVTAAAYLQARHDERSDAHSLARSWQKVGGDLVNLHLVGNNVDGGLNCFRFQFDPDRTDLCFDSANRLVESIEETEHGASVTNILTNVELAPVTLNPQEMARDSSISGEVALFGAVSSQARGVIAPCRTVIGEAPHDIRRASGTPRGPGAIREALHEIASECRSAAKTVETMRQAQHAYPTLSHLLALLEISMSNPQSSALALQARSASTPAATALSVIADDQKLMARAAATLAKLDSLQHQVLAKAVAEG